MKRGTTSIIDYKVDFDFSNMKYAEFIFKQEENENEEPLLYFSYPSQEVEYADGIFHIKLTEQDTRKLPVGIVNLDMRIITEENEVLSGNIKKIRIENTLFK